MSTTRSFRTVRPFMASTVIGFSGLMSLISVLQARRFLPLMRIASEPQMPWAQERRNVRVPSSSHLILWRASRTRSFGSISSWKSSQLASAATSGLNRRMRKVTVM
ncbi:hypothetical protein SVIOM74S_00236 [Streptomyces violarus]